MKSFAQSSLRLILVTTVLVMLTACAPIATPASAGETGAAAGEAAPVVVYSGRNENLVGPLPDRYDVGGGVEVRYGGTSEMAATILEGGITRPPTSSSARTPARWVRWLGPVAAWNCLRPSPSRSVPASSAPTAAGSA
ncbi:MAG: hypothetical protein R3A10_08440 [Caldilineaceae bacterium]